MSAGDTRMRSRRELLKTLVFGGSVAYTAKTIPNKWVTPFIDSVFLPAHAVTSEDRIYSGTVLLPQAVSANRSGTDGESGLLAEALDTIVPEANSAQSSGSDGWWACVMVQAGGTTAMVNVAGLGYTTDVVGAIRRGVLNLDGSKGEITATGDDLSPCETSRNEAKVRPAWIVPGLTNDSQLVLDIQTVCGANQGGPNPCDRPVLRLLIPRANACLPEPPVNSVC